MKQESDILEKIEALQPDMVNWATDIVSFPTLSGQEKEAQGYVAEQLEALGFNEVDMWEPAFESLKDHEAFISPRQDFHGSPNVVGRLKGSGGGRSIILNSHIDVVPEGDRGNWRFAPFGGQVHDGRIYGRGVSDMKGTLASFFVALKAFKELDLRLKGDVIVQSVIEEESGGAGTLACAVRGYRADAAIIPEPSGFAICPAQQGSAWFRVTVSGLSAHGGLRYQGVSAIEMFSEVFPLVAEIEKDLNRRYANPLYAGVPIPYTINVGRIQGGNWPSSVPESVAFEGRIGVPPGMTLEEARSMFSEGIAASASRNEWLAEHPPTVEWWGACWGSAQIDPEHPIVECAKKGFAAVAGTQPVVAGTPWGTDGRMLTDFADTPALVFGPGTSAHGPDEFMPVDDLLRYSKMLALILREWCAVA